MTQEKQEKPSPVIQLPSPKEQTKAVPERILLAPQAQETVGKILKRDSQSETTPEDVVAMAVEVFNILTDHLSQKDSKVILYTLGEGLKTLEIRRSSTMQPQGGRTIEKQVQPPKMHGGR